MVKSSNLYQKFFLKNLTILKKSNIQLYQAVLKSLSGYGLYKSTGKEIRAIYKRLEAGRKPSFNTDLEVKDDGFLNSGLAIDSKGEMGREVKPDFNYPVIFLGSAQIEKINKIISVNSVDEVKNSEKRGVGREQASESCLEKKRGVLIESSIEAFLEFLQFVHPEVLKSLYIIVSDNSEYVNKALSFMSLEDFDFTRAVVSISGGFRLKNREFCNSVLGYIRKRIDEEVASLITERAFSRLWARNIKKNLNYFSDRIYRTEKLTGMFNGRAILVASGPWLEDGIELLKKLSGSYPIFSLLPSTDFLITNGISPDLVLTTDPGFGNRYRICRTADTILVAALTTDPVLLRNWNGKVLFFSHELDIEKKLSGIYGNLLKVPMEGTSAVVLIRLAEKLGFNELLLFGYDFCFRGLMDHHRGAGFEKYYVSRANRLTPLYSMKLNDISSDLLMKVKLEDGEIVYTTKKLLLYRGWLEENRGKSRLYRMTKGLQIKGIPAINGPGVFTVGNNSQIKKRIKEYVFDLIGSPLRRDDVQRALDKLRQL